MQHMHGQHIEAHRDASATPTFLRRLRPRFVEGSQQSAQQRAVARLRQPRPQQQLAHAVKSQGAHPAGGRGGSLVRPRRGHTRTTAGSAMRRTGMGHSGGRCVSLGKRQRQAVWVASGRLVVYKGSRLSWLRREGCAGALPAGCCHGRQRRLGCRDVQRNQAGLRHCLHPPGLQAHAGSGGTGSGGTGSAAGLPNMRVGK